GPPRLHLDPPPGRPPVDEAERAVRTGRHEAGRQVELRPQLARAERRVLHARRQPAELLRLAALGVRAAEQPDRAGDLHVLAARPDLVPPGRLVGAPRFASGSRRPRRSTACSRRRGRRSRRTPRSERRGTHSCPPATATTATSAGSDAETRRSPAP